MRVLGKYAPFFTGIEIDPVDFPHHDAVDDYLDDVVKQYDLCPQCLPAILQIKRMIRSEYTTHSFRVALSGNVQREIENPKNHGATTIIPLAEFTNLFDGLRVVADIRKNYLRHYPGKCLRDTGESFLDGFDPSKVFVYIAFFDKATYDPIKLA